MSEKKKLSFGKIWIIVCVIAAVLGLALAHVAIIMPEMEYYNTHEHWEGCYEGDWSDVRELDCSYSRCDNAFSYAVEYGDGMMAYIVFGGGALALANVVMLILWLVRRNKEKAAMAPQAAPVSIPMAQASAEQVVLERSYTTPFAYVMTVWAGLSALMGVIIALEDDIDEAAPLLIIGALLGVIAFLLFSLKIHLIVTTKRVRVEAPFANRVNMPLSRISAVGTGLFHYLSITSAAGFSGQIRLWFVPKYLEVYETINSLLNQVQ